MDVYMPGAAYPPMINQANNATAVMIIATANKCPIFTLSRYLVALPAQDWC